MSNLIPVTVFTGAGASRANPINLPTMTEFFNQIMDENRWPKSPRISDQGYFKFIFDTIYGSEKNYDLERVMGALYSLKEFTNDDAWKIFNHPNLFQNIVKDLKTEYTHLRKLDGNIEAIENGINLMKKSTVNTYETYKNSAKQLIFELEWLIREKYEEIPNEHIRTVYEPLFDVLIKNAISMGEVGLSPIVPFFTTNYDMSIDCFFNPENDSDIKVYDVWQRYFKKRLQFIDGFSTRGWVSNEYRKIDEDSKNTLYIPYFKLHGSLYWEKRAGRIRMGTNTANDPHNPRDLMIVYPSDKKILNEDPYYFNHRSLELYLKRTNIFIIIGFSFRDPALVTMFETALLDNDRLQILVIAPKLEDESYFPEMARFLKLPKVTQIEGYFGEKDVIGKITDFLNSEFLEISKMIIGGGPNK